MLRYRDVRRSPEVKSRMKKKRFPRHGLMFSSGFTNEGGAGKRNAERSAIEERERAPQRPKLSDLWNAHPPSLGAREGLSMEQSEMVPHTTRRCKSSPRFPRASPHSAGMPNDRNSPLPTHSCCHHHHQNTKLAAGMSPGGGVVCS